MCTTHSTKLHPEDMLRTSPKEIRISVFGLTINYCYITIMTSTAQNVDDTKGRDINYMS